MNHYSYKIANAPLKDMSKRPRFWDLDEITDNLFKKNSKPSECLAPEKEKKRIPHEGKPTEHDLTSVKKEITYN